MKISLIRHRDFVAGFFFLSVGIGTAWGSTVYNLGTAMRMGPGYFPLLLGVLLASLGLLLLAKNVRFVDSIDRSRLIEKPCLRSLTLIAIAMLLFAFTLQVAGLVVSTIALVIVSGIAYRSFSWREISLLCGGLATFASIIFAYGLGLPLQVFPT